MTRAQIKKLLVSLNKEIEAAENEIEQSILVSMQDYFEERSESWQESEKGEEYSELISNLESALETLRAAKEELQEIAES